jgi:hypothetical protein
VAVTLVNDDYHTAPHLMRLAMAEAAAHGASYLSWPTWPEGQRERMIKIVRPQADLLRRNEALLNDTTPRADVVLFLPFQRWLIIDECAASALAVQLTKANFQYRVVDEDGLAALANESRLPAGLLIESESVLTPEQNDLIAQLKKNGVSVIAADRGDWLATLQQRIGEPSVAIEGSPTVRAVVHDQPEKTVVHLFNLNVQRLSSFEDRITPINDVKVRVRVPFKPRDVSIQSADEGTTKGALQFDLDADENQQTVPVTVPRLDISAIITIDK